MIAREQELVPIQENHVSASMTRRGNRQQIPIDLDGLNTTDDALNTLARRTIIRVHHALAAVSLPEQIVICDVVLMRQKQLTNAAHRVDPFDQLRGETRRVDQQISFGPDDEITPRTETVFRSKPAEIDVVSDPERKRVNPDMRIVLCSRTNRSGWTSHQRHHRVSRLVVGLRLVMDAALISVVAKDRRRELTTSVAVDAGGIYKEIARHILG